MTRSGPDRESMEDLKNRNEGGPENPAVEWFVRLSGEPSEQDRRAFADWLEAAPANRKSYAEVESLWRQLDQPSLRVAKERRAHLAALLGEEQPRTRRQGRGAGLSMAACLIGIIVTAGVWMQRPHLVQDLMADQYTPRGVQRLVSLPDGSSVFLDADSAIDLEYSDHVRAVRLLRGRAFFSVVHSSVPFRVEAANGEERDLGTKFEVALYDDNATVTVSEGRVAVMVPGYPEAILTPSEQVTYGADGLEKVSSIDLSAASAWQHGRLVFYRVPLSTVVEAIGRNYRGRILILNHDLAQQRVTINAPADPETALASLQHVVGFRRYTIASHLILLR